MHDFIPVAPGVPQCAALDGTCGLPPGNGRHTAVATEPPPEDAAARRRAALHDELKAEGNFHALMLDPDSPKTRVFCAIAIAGTVGATDDELYRSDVVTGLGPNTIRPRRVDLADEQLVMPATDDQNRVLKRATQAGGLATVWVLTPKAKYLLRDWAKRPRKAAA